MADTDLDLIRDLVQHHRDGVMAIDDRGRIVTHNERLVELLGQPANSFVQPTLRLWL